MIANARASVLVALCAVGTVAPARTAEAQSPVGVWNIQSNDMTDRATGGIRVVLLRVEEDGRDLAAEITSIRNTFTPVDEFEYDDGTMHVRFGSYEYTLNVHGDQLTGTLVSPLGTQPLEGQRQHRTLMYVGDEGIAFRTERTGMLGVVMDTSGPTNDEPDPVGWVRSRIRSAEDLALLNGRARVPVQFANVREHEARLLELAGTRVTVRGVWVGEKIRIEEIEPAAP